MECIGFLIMLCKNHNNQFFPWFFGTCLFGFLTFVCFKKPKKVKTTPSQFPSETLQEIKTNYPKSNISCLIQQIKDSVVLIQSTTNIETLLSRREFALKQCYTLKELEDCGMYKGNFSSQQCIDDLNLNLNTYMKRCYDDYYIKAHQLKTETGIQNRMDKFWIILDKYLDEYSILDFKEFIK